MEEMHPLRKFLLRNDKTVATFAEETGINESTIYLWLKGDSFPSQSNLIKLKNAMNYEDPINLYKEWKEWQETNAE